MATVDGPIQEADMAEAIREPNALNDDDDAEGYVGEVSVSHDEGDVAREIESLVESVRPGKTAAELMAAYKGHEDELAHNLRKMRTEKEIESLVEVTHPGKTAAELLAAFSGKEDELVHNLRKMQAEQETKKEIESLVETTKPGKRASELLTEYKGNEDQLAKNLRKMQTKKEIESLVEITHPGKTSAELMAKFSGREDELVHNLRKMKAEKEIQSLVESTHPGKTAAELLEEFSGREDELAKNLRKMKAEQDAERGPEVAPPKAPEGEIDLSAASYARRKARELAQMRRQQNSVARIIAAMNKRGIGAVSLEGVQVEAFVNKRIREQPVGQRGYERALDAALAQVAALPSPDGRAGDDGDEPVRGKMWTAKDGGPGGEGGPPETPSTPSKSMESYLQRVFDTARGIHDSERQSEPEEEEDDDEADIYYEEAYSAATRPSRGTDGATRKEGDEEEDAVDYAAASSSAREKLADRMNKNTTEMSASEKQYEQRVKARLSSAKTENTAAEGQSVLAQYPSTAGELQAGAYSANTSGNVSQRKVMWDAVDGDGETVQKDVEDVVAGMSRQKVPAAPVDREVHVPDRDAAADEYERRVREGLASAKEGREGAERMPPPTGAHFRKDSPDTSEQTIKGKWGRGTDREAVAAREDVAASSKAGPHDAVDPGGVVTDSNMLPSRQDVKGRRPDPQDVRSRGEVDGHIDEVAALDKIVPPGEDDAAIAEEGASPDKTADEEDAVEEVVLGADESFEEEVLVVTARETEILANDIEILEEDLKEVNVSKGEATPQAEPNGVKGELKEQDRSPEETEEGLQIALPKEEVGVEDEVAGGGEKPAGAEGDTYEEKMAEGKKPPEVKAAATMRDDDTHEEKMAGGKKPPEVKAAASSRDAGGGRAAKTAAPRGVNASFPQPEMEAAGKKGCGCVVS